MLTEIQADTKIDGRPFFDGAGYHAAKHSPEAIEMEKNLRYSAGRALQGRTPPSLRAVFAEIEKPCIRFHCYFDMTADENDREMLSQAAAELIADFREPWYIDEWYGVVETPEEVSPLELTLFLREPLPSS
jgi:hypothetical protein